MFKKSTVLMGHLTYSLGPLSIMVGVVTLLQNKMAAMGVNYLAWKNIWQIFNYLLRRSVHCFEWITTWSLFSILWKILMKICALEEMNT